MAQDAADKSAEKAAEKAEIQRLQARLMLLEGAQAAQPSGFQTPKHDRTEEDSSQPAENVSAAGDSPSTEDASVIGASTVLPPT
eukprot:CAMPEP_0171835150 /NCGR_PEP_ID=MMETSP0992-20121227/10820_1 /TAXON_ID=483369 /ORGANISM="non described non described, Strain CCMP2098" /LENGTH=83 /DNA_ID=CAMNT_0012450935 /DNA_START=272 /DNA_END=519 /DNA_ORIENTATION=+